MRDDADEEMPTCEPKIRCVMVMQGPKVFADVCRLNSTVDRERLGMIVRMPLRALLQAIYASLILTLAGTLIGGGATLLYYGGSLYYLAAGVALAWSAADIFRARSRGATIYCAVLVATIAWSVWEVGLDFWALLPRLGTLLALGGVLPFLRFRDTRYSMRNRRAAGVFAAAVCLAAPVGLVLSAIGPERPSDPLWQTGEMQEPPAKLPKPMVALNGGDWPNWGNNPGGSRFSPLEDVDITNADRLQVAWEADFGSKNRSNSGSMQATPIMIGETLYLCNASNEVLALDAETGSERWRHDMTAEQAPVARPCRGVSYYRVASGEGPCIERIIAPTQTAEIVAIDARTGLACTDFGVNGRVSLREGLKDAPLAHYYLSSAPQIVRGRVVVGGPVLDGQIWSGPSGVIRAYDAVTGRLSWAFDIGNPDRIGAPGPGEEYTPSTPNSWAPISADEELGLVYLPMGNTNGSDFYGGMRRPFDEEISSSVIALDVETGRLRWRFQTLHHDVWDYDVPSQPTLVDMPTATGVRLALVQPTKRGEIFVIDRETGQPIKPVEERSVPQGGLASGEWLSPTQPFSIAMPSLRGADLREADMWGVTPIDQLICRIEFAKSRYEGHLTPLTPGKATIQTPGYSGGSNWGSISVDVDRGILIANHNYLPSRMTLVAREEADREGIAVYSGQGAPSSARPQMNTPYAITGGPFLSVTGAPCSRPAYGKLSAIDLMTGRVIWSKPLGTARDIAPFGIASQLPILLGAPTVGGSLVTRGGVTFIGATQEHSFRAIETATGRLLWETRLPGGGNAVPMTYRAPSGRQIVLVAAGGNGSLKSKRSTKLVAYALPR